jgi:hypothetical protein
MALNTVRSASAGRVVPAATSALSGCNRAHAPSSSPKASMNSRLSLRTCGTLSAARTPARSSSAGSNSARSGVIAPTALM